MARVLAIDPSSTEVGVFTGGYYTTIVANKKSPRSERLGFIANALAEIIEQFEGFDFIIYEEQFVRGDAATRALYGAVGIIEAVGTLSGAGVMPIPQSTVRKWVRECLDPPVKLPPKELYREAAALFYGHDFAERATEHECDAAVIYHYIKQNGEFNV